MGTPRGKGNSFPPLRVLFLFVLRRSLGALSAWAPRKKKKKKKEHFESFHSDRIIRIAFSIVLPVANNTIICAEDGRENPLRLRQLLTASETPSVLGLVESGNVDSVTDAVDS